MIVMMGKGDGTFATPVEVGTKSPARALAVANFGSGLLGAAVIGNGGDSTTDGKSPIEVLLPACR